MIPATVCRAGFAAPVSGQPFDRVPPVSDSGNRAPPPSNAGKPWQPFDRGEHRTPPERRATVRPFAASRFR